MKWITLLLLVLSVFYCGDGEKKQLLDQLDRLTAEKDKYSEVIDLAEKLNKARLQLSRTSNLIETLKSNRGFGNKLNAAFQSIPDSVLLKEFCFSSRTLNFTLLFPSKDSVSAFIGNLVRTGHFERIESFPKEGQISKGRYKYKEYTVIFDLKWEETKDSKFHYNRGFVYSTGYSEQYSGESDTEYLKRRIKRLQRVIEQAKLNKGKESEMRKSLRTTRKTTVKLEGILPDNMDKKQVIKEIQVAATQSKIKIIKCSEGEIRKKEIYLDVHFFVKVTAPFKKIIHFFQMLEKQKRFFRVYVPTLYLTFPSGKIQEGPMDMSFSLTTYVRDFDTKRRKNVPGKSGRH